MRVRHKMMESYRLATDPYRPRAVRRLLDELQQVAPEELPSKETLEALRRAWGNRKWSAEPVYLREIAQRSRDALGPIVECGSCLSTLVAAIYAPADVPIFALEHQSVFCRRVAKTAKKLKLSNTNVIEAALVGYGDFEWYQLPQSIPQDVALVICDGPPAFTRGGRYGALPVLKDLASPDVLILMDDADVEKETLDRWKTEFDARYDIVDSTRARFAVVCLR